jgi:hypothetical protein
VHRADAQRHNTAGGKIWQIAYVCAGQKPSWGRLL